jgi:hypothetical protein
MGETNSPSVAHVGYDISPLSRVKLKFLNLTGSPRVTEGESIFPLFSDSFNKLLLNISHVCIHKR